MCSFELEIWFLYLSFNPLYLNLCMYISQVYKHCTTHLITPQVLPSEKFLAACAAGQSLRLLLNIC